MKIGDLVKISSDLVPSVYQDFEDCVGIITEIHTSEMNDDGCHSRIVYAMFNEKVDAFLPRFLEVISEGR